MLLMVLMRARLCEKNQRERNRERGGRKEEEKKCSLPHVFEAGERDVHSAKVPQSNPAGQIYSRTPTNQGPRLLEIPAMSMSPDAFSSISGDRGRETLVRLIELLVPDDPAADDDTPARMLLLPEILFSGAAAAAPAAVAFSTTCA